MSITADNLKDIENKENKNTNINIENIENIHNIENIAKIRYLEPRSSKFSLTEGGFLSLHIENKDKSENIENYDRVNFYRAFPFKYAREYISVRTIEDKEIGIIKNMDDYPEETIKLFDYELNRRYFTPIIEKINRIKEEFGYSYWDVLTNSGSKRFTVQNIHNNVIQITQIRILVIDVDGNRFEIPDYKKLDLRSLKIVERLL